MAPSSNSGQSALVQRNLNLLANGNDSAEYLLICGNKHWNVHKLIVEAASAEFYAMLVSNADRRDRVYLEENTAAMNNVMNFVYTLTYSLWPVGPQYICKKKAELAKHIYANGLAGKYDIPQLAADSKAAFVAMKPTMRFTIVKHWRGQGNPATESQITESWKNKRAMVRAGELIMIWRDRLDPDFEAYYVWWLWNHVTYICDFDCSEFCKLLDTKLNPLAKKANLRRRKDGTWEGKLPRSS